VDLQAVGLLLLMWLMNILRVLLMILIICCLFFLIILLAPSGCSYGGYLCMYKELRMEE